MDNLEILRGVVTTGDIGTPGAGLLSPEQFEALVVLAEAQIPWAQLQDTARRTALTGSISTIDFGDDVIEPATEAIDTGNLLEPTHSAVAYAMTKGRVAFSYSFEGMDQQAIQNAEPQIVDGFGRAFGRSLQKCAWLGDSTSGTPMLAMNDGWVKQIFTSGVAINGAAINGGDISPQHFFAAKRGLPVAWQQRTNELRWAIGITHMTMLEEFLSARATGEGDRFLTRGADGQLMIAGIEAVPVPCLTTDLCLVHPQNTTVVLHPRTFQLRPVREGLSVVGADITVWIGHFHSDYVLKEVTGAANVYGLNAS